MSVLLVLYQYFGFALSYLYIVAFLSFYDSICKISQINEVKEMSLSANQEKSEMRRMKWRVEGDAAKEHIPIRGRPVSSSSLLVELGPMEIRTFLLKF